jgi:hypothetical protein
LRDSAGELLCAPMPRAHPASRQPGIPYASELARRFFTSDGPHILGSRGIPGYLGSMSQLTRDQFLKLIAAGGASFLGLNIPAPAQELLKGPAIPWGRLKFTGEYGDQEDWHVHPQGDLNLIDSIRNGTSVNLDKKWNVADVADLKSMTQYPFLFMHGEIAPELDATSVQNLREYLLAGGFLFAEDCVNGYGHHGSNRANDYFFRAMMGQMPSVLPGSTIVQLPMDHPIFHCFYHFDVWPHMQGTNHGPQGVMYDGRLVGLISPSDLHCGWVNGDRWFGEGKQRQAMQMGANIYLYAMTQAS